MHASLPSSTAQRYAYESAALASPPRTLSPASPEAPRHSLAFILDQEETVVPTTATASHTHSLWSSSRPSPAFSSGGSEEVQSRPHGRAAPVAPLPRTQEDATLRRSRDDRRSDRRRARACTAAGCPNYTIDHGLCFRHGGGKHCSIDGCTTSAKHRGFCWKHGGSTACSVDGCTRGAKSKGLCWSHGGANKCTIADCEKMTISKGLCWSHGGGKRCIFDDCKRPASKKTLGFCVRHGAEVSQVDYVYEI